MTENTKDQNPIKRVYYYKITNILDGKKYIGQTVNIRRRWYSHRRSILETDNSQKQCVHRALSKHSIENFVFEEIASCIYLNQEEADILEDELIDQHQSLVSQWGYNVKKGGRKSTFEYDPERKAEISKKLSENWERDHPEKRKIKITPEQEQRICELYKAGTSKASLVKSENLLTGKIKEILENNNIEIRDPVEENRKLKPNHNCLDNINSELKAYLLGFIFANGAMSAGENNYRISVKTVKNQEILNILSDFIYNKNLVKYSHNYAVLAFSSKNIYEKLNSYGLFKNKNINLKFPNNIAEEYIHHFVRGYFDGAGKIISYVEDNLICGKADFTSSISFCNELQKIIETKCNFTFNRKKSSEHTDIIKIGGNLKIINLADYLYKDATIFASDKKAKFDFIKEQTLKHNPSLKPLKITFSQEQIADIIAKYSAGTAANKIGEDYNCSGNFIRKTLRDNGCKVRSISEANRKYYVNESYFDSIDCQEKAFFLGLILSAAVPYVNEGKGTYQISFKLPVEKADHLRRLSIAIFEEDRVTVDDKAYLLICSKTIIKRLEELGLETERKFPTISEQFVDSFLSGIRIGKERIFKTGNRLRHSLTLSTSLANGVKSILSNKGLKVRSAVDERVSVKTTQLYFDISANFAT